LEEGDWKDGRMEGGKIGRGEGWKIGRMEEFIPSILLVLYPI
jgi:hypothetical protein